MWASVSTIIARQNKQYGCGLERLPGCGLETLPRSPLPGELAAGRAIGCRRRVPFQRLTTEGESGAVVPLFCGSPALNDAD